MSQFSDIHKKEYVWRTRRLNAKFYLYSNKTGKLMANKLKGRLTRTKIAKLKMASAEFVAQPRQIANRFAEYYAQLYNLHLDGATHQPSLTEVFSYLTSIALPQLSPTCQDTLTTPISHEELMKVLSSLPPHKSPGPDGFSTKYYTTFAEQLTPHMLSLFNYLFDSGTAPPELLKASIVTIPKPGKDPTLCSNYRPISLLNVDIKIYAKILANRLAPLLPKLVADDQVGFIQGRQGTDNTVRLLNIIDRVGRDSAPCLLLSLDAEKAFDRLNWLFLRHVLLKFNFPLPFIEAVFTLYSSPTAQVLNAGFPSDTVNITNGTRQGCPLSPLLYALALEPLAQTIRAGAQITGIQIGPTESKISLFADDILLTLTDPINSLPQLHHLLTQYGKVSYHQINIAKTQALSTHLSPTDLNYLKSTYKYDWRAVYLLYLGIKISFSRPTLYRLNYGAMLSMI
uniref:Reverse transcriptase domain-containing protein n=1 Tax=Leptobrachium leishanense TaxID=445787 RepID=A0A8C5PGE3_9ANUR